MIAKASAIQHGQAMTNYATKNNRADIVKTNHLSEGLPPMGMWDEMVLHQSMFKQRYAKKPIELTSIRFELSPSEEEARNWTMEDWRRFLDEFIREMDGISKVNHIGKKFLGYRPGVAVIGDLIVGIENSDGNTNVRFHQKDTLKRFFERFEQNKLIINRFRADCGSCSEEIVEEIAKHCKTFYIRANRCSSLYNDIFALRGWKKVKLGGIEFELASILIEKWKGKAYRLVIQRQKRIDGELDLWEGEYTYRCILTNDYESSEKEIVEFYNLRGGKD